LRVTRDIAAELAERPLESARSAAAETHVADSGTITIDVYNSREVENNIYYEGSYTISYRRSSFSVETNAFNALWALGVLGVSMRTKPSSGKHRLEATNAVDLAGFNWWMDLTTLVLGRHNPKFNQSYKNSKGIERFCPINNTVCGHGGKLFLG
jgi:hypothetical protein